MAPGRGDQAVGHDRLRVRPDRQLDASSRDRRVAGPPDADDPAVLDADVGLDDADERGRRRARPRRRRRAPTDPAGPGSPRGRMRLRVAPDRLVAVAWRSSSTRTHRSVSARRTRSPVVGPYRARRSSGRGGSPSRLAAERGRAGPSASRPAPSARRAGGKVEMEAGRRRAIELEPAVHAVERIVRTRPGRRGPSRCGRRGRWRRRPTRRAAHPIDVPRLRPSPVGSRPGRRPRRDRAGRAGRRAGRRRPSATSRRTSSTSDATPGITSSGETARTPGRLDLLVRRAGPRRLEHGIADQGDRLGRAQRGSRPRGGAGRARPR